MPDADGLATPTTSRRGRFRRRTYGVVAALALVGAVIALFGVSTPSVPLIQVLSQAPHRSSSPRVATLAAIPRSRPVNLRIPAIGVETALVVLGLQSDGQVEMPTTTRVAGWYDDGPAPGQVGSAVILGHVDSYLGPGVFFQLKKLKAGDDVEVTLADGTMTRFEVTRVVLYAKSAFPDRLVYGSHGGRALQIVTCGGTFDSLTGHYVANVVVFTRLVSLTTPTSETH